MGILSNFPTSTGDSGGRPSGEGIALCEIKNVSVSAKSDTLSFKWSDPDDLYLDDALVAAWSKTKLVYKQGDVSPVTLTDGILAVENTGRNQFAETPFVLTGLTPDTTYSFTWFVETQDIQVSVFANRLPTNTTPVYQLIYKGVTASLKIARNMLAATSVGNYALFGGGRKFKSATSSELVEDSTVDVYNLSLTHTTASNLSVTRELLISTTTKKHAIFAGGNRWNSSSKAMENSAVVDAYNDSLTRTVLTPLSSIPVSTATAIGGKALLNSYNGMNAYDENLVRISVMPLSPLRGGASATSVGNYAIFAGGSSSSATDAYDPALTRISVSPLIDVRYDSAAITVGNYAIFAGGIQSGKYSDTVEVYDNFLTKRLVEPLSVTRSEPKGTSLEDYGIIGGGLEDSTFNSVDIYSTSLVHTTLPSISSSLTSCAATSIGDYALFGGGSIINRGLQSTVYIFTLE